MISVLVVLIFMVISYVYSTHDSGSQFKIFNKIYFIGDDILVEIILVNTYTHLNNDNNLKKKQREIAK